MQNKLLATLVTLIMYIIPQGAIAQEPENEPLFRVNVNAFYNQPITQRFSLTGATLTSPNVLEGIHPLFYAGAEGQVTPWLFMGGQVGLWTEGLQAPIPTLSLTTLWVPKGFMAYTWTEVGLTRQTEVYNFIMLAHTPDGVPIQLGAVHELWGSWQDPESLDHGGGPFMAFRWAVHDQVMGFNFELHVRQSPLEESGRVVYPAPVIRFVGFFRGPRRKGK